MKINNSMAILFWPHNQKINSSGEAPIYCRITIDGKRTPFSTGLKIDAQKWSSENGKAIGNSQEAKNLNEDLDTIRGNLRKIYNQLQSKNQYVTGEMIKKVFTGQDQEKKTIMDIFTFFNSLLKKKVDQKLASHRHWLRFEGIKKNIASYLRKDHSISDQLLCDIRPFFSEEFYHYLILHQKVSENTAMNYVKKTKQVLNLAVRKGWLTKNPITEFRCIYKQPNRTYLTMDEINTLTTAKMPTTCLDEVRDMYLFSCFTGYAYKELKNLSPENIMIGIDGKKWLTIDRAKTDGREALPLLPIPLQLVDKYKNHPFCLAHNVLLPVKSNQKYNDYIKEVATAAGITKYLTTHTARHTFATTVALEHDVPIETVAGC